MSNSDIFMKVIKLLQDRGMSSSEIPKFFARSHLATTEALFKNQGSLGSIIVDEVTGELVTITHNIDTPEMNQKIIEALQKNILEITPDVSMQA